GTAAATVDGKPRASKAPTWPMAVLPAASAVRDDGQSPPRGVTAPTPRTNTGRCFAIACGERRPRRRSGLLGRAVQPDVQHLAPAGDQLGVLDLGEGERQLALDGQLAVQLRADLDLPAGLLHAQRD